MRKNAFIIGASSGIGLTTAKKSTVNALQIGVTDTPSLRRILEVEELFRSSRKRNQSGRLTTPEDVANVIYFMGQPEAFRVSGCHIHVGGGQHLV